MASQQQLVTAKRFIAFLIDYTIERWLATRSLADPAGFGIARDACERHDRLTARRSTTLEDGRSDVETLAPPHGLT